jgi:hypothetical protein
MHFLFKYLYAYVAIKDGQIRDYSHKLPKAFIVDLKDVLPKDLSGKIYIKEKNTTKALMFSGAFSDRLKQRVFNIWGVHKSRYR